MNSPEIDLQGYTLDGMFYLRESIGSGGMGDVYQAWDQTKLIPVAVKILKPSELQRRHQAQGTYAAEQFVRMFAAEASVMRSLDHPNIVHIYELRLDKQWGLAFFVMEWINGKDLAQILGEKKTPLSLEETGHILYYAAIALNYAHVQKRVHCDIKPGNIMKDKNDRVIVADFGLARMISEKGLGGTPAYMAPEQYAGHEVTPQTDVYALGVTLFQLLTNQLPFTGDRPDSQGQGNPLERLRWEHLNMKPPPLRQYNPSIPEAAEKVVLKAMAKKQRSRFSNTIDLTTAFTAAIRGRHYDPPPPSDTPPPPPPTIDEPHLIGRAGHYAGRIIIIPEGDILIGRGAEANLPLVEQYKISREHAMFKRRGNKIWLEDRSTFQQTFVNDQRMYTQTPIYDKTRIRFGDFDEFECVIPSGGK